MKYLIVAFITFLIAILPLFSQTLPEVSLPNASVAILDNAMSIKTNPAGLSVPRAAEIFIASYSRSGAYERNGGFYARLLGLGIGADFIDEASVRYNRYFVGLGFNFGYGLNFGASHYWFKHLDAGSGWNLGFQFRPNSFFSVGAAALNINSPHIKSINLNANETTLNSSLNVAGNKIKPRYNIGIAIKPLTERFTYSVDASFFTDNFTDYADSLDWTFRADFEAWEGLNLSMEYKPQAEFIGGGITVSFPHFQFQTNSNVHNSGEGVGSSHIFHLSYEKMKTLPFLYKDRYIFASLDGPIVEEEAPWTPLGRMNYPSLYRIVKAIHRLQEDDNVRGLVLKLGGLDCGFAIIQEIREALINFRLSGKDLIIYSESFGNKEYYLATAANAIYLSPSGYLGLTGLSYQVLFMKGAYDKLGINAEMEHIGKYKNSSDYVTREGMSSAQLEAETALLESFYDDFSTNIAYDRGIEHDSIDAVIDRGPFTSNNAYLENLVDSLIYPDELEAIVKKRAGDDVELVENGRYWRFRDYKYGWGEPFIKRIAIIYATGTIITGESTESLFSGKMMGAETISRSIKEAREDPFVKAIILRIDSPGGDGIASDLIWREVKLTTTGEDAKPFIVSMGDVAASGGYYIACMADTIVADPGTITGSIGVISGKYDLSGLYEKIGLKPQIIKRGKRADFFTSARPWTEEEREHHRKLTQDFYDDFVSRVAEGRNMSVDKVEEVAQGRVWTGDQAWELGLVDEIGSLYKAIQIAMGMAGVMPGERAAFRFFPKQRWIGIDGFVDTFIESRMDPESLKLIQAMNRTTKMYNGRILYLMPYEPEIK